jgi:hypothetical protein
MTHVERHSAELILCHSLSCSHLKGAFSEHNYVMLSIILTVAIMQIAVMLDVVAPYNWTDLKTKQTIKLKGKKKEKKLLGSVTYFIYTLHLSFNFCKV